LVEVEKYMCSCVHLYVRLKKKKRKRKTRKRKTVGAPWRRCPVVGMHPCEHNGAAKVSREDALPLALFVGDDHHKFLATVSALGGDIAMSLVCIRGSATTRPKF
jgi:hypothetical protein